MHNACCLDDTRCNLLFIGFTCKQIFKNIRNAWDSDLLLIARLALYQSSHGVIFFPSSFFCCCCCDRLLRRRRRHCCYCCCCYGCYCCCCCGCCGRFLLLILRCCLAKCQWFFWKTPKHLLPPDHHVEVQQHGRVVRKDISWLLSLHNWSLSLYIQKNCINLNQSIN